MRFLKKHWLAILTIGGGFLLFCLYTFFYHYKFGRADILFENQLLYLTIVDKYFQGTLTFGDLWAPLVEHRHLGYHVFYLLNAIYLNLSSFAEYYVNVLAMLLVTIMAYSAFYKSLEKKCGGLKTQILFVPIVLIMLGLTNWSFVAFGGMLVSVMWGSVFYVMAFVFANKLFFQWSRKDAMYFVVATLLGTWVFGGSYFLVFFSALFFGYLVRLLFEKKFDWKVLSLMVGVMLLGVGVYLYDYPIIGHTVGKLVHSEYSLWHILQFGLLVVANTITQTSLFEAGFNNLTVLTGIGVLVLGLYLYALRIFKVSGMYKKTYMPMFFMGNALALFLMVTLIRSDQTLFASFATWWYAHTKFGLVAILWIFAYYYFHGGGAKWEKRLWTQKGVLAFSLLVLFSGTLYSNWSEFWLLDSRRAVLVNTRNAVLFNREVLEANIAEKEALQLENPELGRGELYTAFYSMPDETRYALDLMEEHKLNIFSEGFQRSVFESNVGKDFSKALLATGWHEPEIGPDGKMYRWVEEDSRTLIRSGENGKLNIEGYFPDFFSQLNYQIFADGVEVGSGVIYPGEFTLAAEIPANKNVLLQLVFDQSLVPGGDVRKLSAMIKQFYTE